MNDVLGDEPVVVTYDPLAGVPRAFRRRVGDRVLEFGVSGLVYNHNFLLYDRETGSLWVQFTGEAIAGPLAGRTLDRLRIRQEPSPPGSRGNPARRCWCARCRGASTTATAPSSPTS